VRVYSYTGFTWPIALATSDWNESEKLTAASEKLSAALEALGAPKVNHAIVTAYDGASHNIGFHFDKARSLHKEGWIAVLKLGPASRPFAVRPRVAREQAKEPCVFHEVVPAGTLILMSMAANLATQHAVPVVENEEVGLSGSIVWRNVQTVLSQAGLARKIASTERGIARREAAKKRKRA